MVARNQTLLLDFINNPDKYVYPFIIKERNKDRTIITYNKGRDYGHRLRAIHETILNQFQENFAQRNSNSFAYHKNVKCLDALDDHLQSNHFIKLDIHHFFESITEEKFFKVYNEYFNDNWKAVLRGCFYKGALSIGFVTSPEISDFYMRDFDRNIEKYLLEHPELHYSRYSDDMLLSSEDDSKESLEKLFEYVQEQLKVLELEINEQKTRRVTLDYDNHNSLTFLGLNLSKKDDDYNKVTISKKYILFLLKLIAKNNLYKGSCRELINEINSRVAYLAYNSAVSFERFQKKYTNIYGTPYNFIPKKPFERTAPLKASDIPNYQEDATIFKFDIHKKVKGKDKKGFGVNDAIEITGLVSKETISKLVIPEYVNSIGQRAFQGRSDIEEVVLNNKLKNLDDGAFDGCVNLQKINLPESLRFIGQQCFRNCPKLKEIVIPNKIKTIHSKTFSFTGLEKVTLGAGVKEIATSAFNNCNELKEVIFNQNLQKIGALAFYSCFNLRTIDLSNTKVEKIEDSAFHNCYMLSEVKLPDSILSIESNVFLNCVSLEKIAIPESLVNIGVNAFTKCPNLKVVDVNKNNRVYRTNKAKNALIEINTAKLVFATKDYQIDDDIKVIGPSCFADSRMTSINLPKSLEAISRYAFNNCKWLKEINIPESVKEIGANAFEGCSSLEKANIPEKITQIDNEVFAKCHNLKELKLHNKIVNIGKGSFSSCENLNISIPNSVKAIGYKAFKDCHAIKELRIPQVTDNINENAFYGLSKSLETIKVDPLNTKYSSGKDANILVERKNGLLILGCKNSTINKEVNTIGAYSFAWCECLKEVSLPYTVQDIEQGAFKDCVNLEKVNLGKVYHIEKGAFKGTRALENITLPDTLVAIGNEAFVDSSLKEITIPNSVSKFGTRIFANCEKLESIHIPSTLTDFDRAMFAGCQNIQHITVDEMNITYDSREKCNAIINKVDSFNTLVYGCRNTVIPQSVKAIGKSAFTDVLGLKKITIPSGVTRAHNSAFQNCSDLEEVDIKALDNISPYMFANCKKLKKVILPDTIEDIGLGAFQNCSSLEEIVLPESIKLIHSHAFDGCKKLKRINIPHNISTIPPSMFDRCESLETIDIPQNIKEISLCAFQGCSKLTDIKLPEQLVSLGGYAFGDTKIKNIHLPATARAISAHAFKGLDLESITIDKNNEYFSDEGSNVITYRDPVDVNNRKHLLLGCKNSIIPNDVEIIDRYSFMSIDGLKKIEIPESVKFINGEAFKDCHDLKSVKFPSRLKEIGDGAFMNCSSLEEISIKKVAKDEEDGLTIFANAFSYCNSLKKIEINGDDITLLLPFKLDKHDQLKTINVHTKNLSSGQNNDMLCTFGSNGVLILATPNCTIPNGIAGISSGAFSGNLGKVVIPESVSSLSDQAFANVEEVEELVLPKTLYEIGEGFLRGVTVKKIVVDKDNPIYITNDENTSLIKRESGCILYLGDDGIISEGTSSIGRYALSRRGIKRLYIPSSLTQLQVTDINTSDLESIEVNKDNPSFYSDNNCLIIKGTTVLALGCNTSVIPDYITTIFTNAFVNCETLSSVHIGKNITYIGKHAFNEKNNISSITVDKANPVFDSRDNCNAIIITKDNFPVLTCPNTKLPQGVEMFEIRTQIFNGRTYVPRFPEGNESSIILDLSGDDMPF